MGTFSIWHWIIVLVVVLVLFGGRGKLSQLMGDAARGINAFKKGLKDEKDVETVKVVEEPEASTESADQGSADNKTSNKNT
tara:strand:+ start:657 stop:899 length:243 start_codon:yes stop_codon:yes gene_type:complete